LDPEQKAKENRGGEEIPKPYWIWIQDLEYNLGSGKADEVGGHPCACACVYVCVRAQLQFKFLLPQMQFL